MYDLRYLLPYQSLVLSCFDSWVPAGEIPSIHGLGLGKLYKRYPALWVWSPEKRSLLVSRHYYMYICTCACMCMYHRFWCKLKKLGSAFGGIMEAARPHCPFFQKVCVTPYYLSCRTKMPSENLDIKKLCQVPNQRVRLFHRMSKKNSYSMAQSADTRRRYGVN